MTEFIKSLFDNELFFSLFRTSIWAVIACVVVALVLRRSIFKTMAYLWLMTIIASSALWTLGMHGIIPLWAVSSLSALFAIAAFVAVLRSIQYPLRHAIDYLTRMTNGEIPEDLEAHGKYELREMTDSIVKLSTELGRLLNTISTKAGDLNKESSHVTSNASLISQEANLQATSVEELSATIEQMSSAISMNLANSRRAKDISDKAKVEMQQVLEQATEMLRSVEKIKEKVSLIDEIASQTNILALNASIEANRAGETGQGFAVVAQNVRDLAAATQEAAAEINQITDATFESAGHQRGERNGRAGERNIVVGRRTAARHRPDKHSHSAAQQRLAEERRIVRNAEHHSAADVAQLRRASRHGQEIHLIPSGWFGEGNKRRRPGSVAQKHCPDAVF